MLVILESPEGSAVQPTETTALSRGSPQCVILPPGDILPFLVVTTGGSYRHLVSRGWDAGQHPSVPDTSIAVTSPNVQRPGWENCVYRNLKSLQAQCDPLGPPDPETEMVFTSDR